MHLSGEACVGRGEDEKGSEGERAGRGNRMKKRPGAQRPAAAAGRAKKRGEPSLYLFRNHSTGRGNTGGERAGVSRGRSTRPRGAGKGRTSKHREES